MSGVEEVGSVDEKKFEKTEIHWKIPDFFTVLENKTVIYSPIFSFANTQWRLHLILKPMSSLGRIRLYLRRIEICGEICPLVYDIGLMKMDGSIEEICKNRMRVLYGEEIQAGPWYIRLSKIVQRKSEFAPLNMLVIICKLTIDDTDDDSEPPRMLDNFKLNTITKTDLLSDNLKDLLTNKDSCDTVLLVKDKEFRVHKALLIARSPVFAAMFRHDTAEKQTGRIIINDCDPDSFQCFLDYLYSGKLEDISPNAVLNLYTISDKYNVHELKLFCTNYLRLNLTVQNICEVVTFADEYNEKDLMCSAKMFFSENIKAILVTSEWENMLKEKLGLANKMLIEMVEDKEETLKMVRAMKR